MPVALPIAIGVSAATGLAGSILQSGAAKSAASGQVQAAQQAGQQVVDTTNKVNPQIGEAATAAGTGVTAAADQAATGVEGSTTAANNLLNPYSTAGSTAVNALTAHLDDYTKMPGVKDIQLDPGFQFALEQGLKALNRTAAAGGGALSGSAAKAAGRYVTDYANTGYTAAFNRYMQNRESSYNNLFNLMNLGKSAAEREGTNLLDTSKFTGSLRTGAAEYAGNANMTAADRMAANSINASRAQGEFLTQGSNAKAAGDVGSANALAGGFAGAGSSLLNALLLSKMFSSPTAGPAVTGNTLPSGGVPGGIPLP